jgi:conjugal transfer/entry exclusion protein
MKLFAGLALFCGIAASASAQWVVFDPSNWVQNYATAIQTLGQYKQMIQQVINSTTELSSLGNPQSLVNATIGQLQIGVQTTENLLSALGNGQTAAQNLVSAYGAAGNGNFNDWISALNKQGTMQSQGVDALAQSVTSSNQAVQDAQAQWAKSNAEISAAPGIHDQLQIVNQNLMTLIQQNQAVNQTLAALAASEAQTAAQQNAQTMSGAQQAADQKLQSTINNGTNWMVQTYGGASAPAGSSSMPQN